VASSGHGGRGGRRWRQWRRSAAEAEEAEGTVSKKQHRKAVRRALGRIEQRLEQMDAKAPQWTYTPSVTYYPAPEYTTFGVGSTTKGNT
jgi:hypothetical protein